MTTNIEILNAKGEVTKRIHLKEGQIYDGWFRHQWVGFMDLFGATSARTEATQIQFEPTNPGKKVRSLIVDVSKPRSTQHGLIVHQGERNPTVSIIYQRRNGTSVTVGRFHRKPNGAELRKLGVEKVRRVS